MCGAVFLLAGCGGGSISTGAGAKALRGAGFHPHNDPGVAARAHYAVKLLQADC